MAAPSIELQEVEATDRKLRRELSFLQLLFFNVGGIIGSGWLFAVLAADAIGGPAVIVGWVVCGVLSLLIALNYAEVAGMLPRSGAIVRYPSLTHGGYAGFILAWSYLLSAVTIPAIEAEAVITYASTYLHGLTTTTNKVTVLTGPGIGLAIVLMLIFFGINYFGVRLLGHFNQWFTWWKLIIPTLTVAFLLVVFHASNFTAHGGFAPMGVKPIFLAISTAGIAFAYFGFRQGLDFGGEAKNPQRDIPLATTVSVILATVLYTALQFAFTGALNWHKLGIAPGAWTALAHSAWAKAPFYDELTQAGVAALVGFGTVLLIDAFASPSGTGWIFMGTSTRVFYGMGTSGYLPKPLRWVNERYRVPWVALIASLVVGCLFFLPLPSWYLLVGFITAALVVTTVTSGIAVAVLRRTAATLHRPYHVPFTPIMAPLGTLSATIIVYWSGFTVLTNLLAAVFIGLPLYAIFYAPGRGWMSRWVGVTIGLAFLAAWIVTEDLGPMSVHALSFPVFFILITLEITAFSGLMWWFSPPEGRLPIERTPWLLFLFLGTYLVSYYGAYGPYKNPPLAFPYGDLLVIGIGLISFYWGVHSGYATEEIEYINSTGSGLVAEEPAEARRSA